MSGPVREPVVAICDVVGRRFAEANARAAADSPLAAARARLGHRYLKVASKALQTRTIAAVTGPGGQETRRMVEATGQLGATTVVVSIVADAIGDIIAAK